MILFFFFNAMFLSIHSTKSSNKEQNQIEIHALRKQKRRVRITLKKKKKSFTSLKVLMADQLRGFLQMEKKILELTK